MSHASTATVPRGSSSASRPVSSAATGQALFVNQRGQRVEDTTLDALARQIIAGRARIVRAEQGRVVDRAWQSALMALRSFAAPPDAPGASTGSAA